VVEAARAVEGFFRAAGRKAAGQEVVFVSVAAGQVDRRVVAEAMAAAPVRQEWFEPLVRAAIYDPNPSFNRQLIEPALAAFGRRRVQVTLLDYLKTGINLERASLAAHDAEGEIAEIRRTIAEADNKVNRYRATLDAGGDPALIAGWITEATAIKKAAQARLSVTEAPPQRMADDQLAAIADAFDSLLRLLRDADPRDKAELYSRIGLRLTYRPGPETMIAEVVTPAMDRVFDWCPRGDRYRKPTRRPGQPRNRDHVAVATAGGFASAARIRSPGGA
jgi:hypothetical protein